MEDDDLFDREMNLRGTGKNEPRYFSREFVVYSEGGRIDNPDAVPFRIEFFRPDPVRGSWEYTGWVMKEKSIDGPSGGISVRYVPVKRLPEKGENAKDGEWIPQDHLFPFDEYHDLVNKLKNA